MQIRSLHHKLAPLALSSSFILTCMVLYLSALIRDFDTGSPSLMTTPGFEQYSHFVQSQTPSRPSRHSKHMLKTTMGQKSGLCEMTREVNTCRMLSSSSLQM